ncbi:pentatricopeptide repeat-containing protein 1, mitochondrial [Anastrepha obliqua]|uniref:pentatricopeptide repeat-containing protein 1, mitochondrial n=1 Tax=Anastrepha obliqua TaxID=95512 RepID=UPI002409FB9B|nr:pentatricopeptide repeat-containing protein 1, mitochondrial [Anastrepha obliqua]XP_054732526.1 pentatricopeptide repeat-containing protein 1, mitochondrial [Anastrepha obliqua]XP_054732527.1 pentatricopeptide repeat-containing protein 1, mitochondrial [Anastrepha obliqua]
MAIRLLQCGTLRQLWCLSNLARTFSDQYQLSLQVSINNFTKTHWCGARSLHMKIYDKDADLEEQRLVNKEQNDPKQFRKSCIDNLSSQETIKSLPDKPDSYNDADVFGTNALSGNIEDPDDLAEEEYTKNPQRKPLRPIDYSRLIKSHLNEKRLKDAIAVLEVQMLKQDRAKPDSYIYNLLISGCAKSGYTRKAFNLFTKMRQRGLNIKGGTYTSLFNACANAPSTAYGLEQANRLREIMIEKGYEPNVKNYNAMIKAYGRCGDVKTAYMLADELMEKQLPLNVDTFNFLLQACASDFEFGFRHCLLTWHKMIKHRLKPDYYTFNTILRCVRDCGFGDLNTMEKVLQVILTERMEMLTADDIVEEQVPLLNKGQLSNLSHMEKKSQAIEIKNNTMELEMPNLLAPQPHLGSLVSLAEVTCPHERFLLLGGLTGFLNLMKVNQVTPDIETFTTLLEVIPPTYAAEKQLLSFVRKIGLKADVDFFNILIKKRSMRFDYEGAKEVMSMIRTAGLQPDIVTYGVLALGCQTVEEARELLQQMRENGIRMNMQILGAMLRQGAEHRNFPYIIEILQISLEENIKPNEIFLTHLHKFYDRCARSIDARHPSTKSKSFKFGHAKFCDKLRLYYEEQGIGGLKLEDAIKKIREHPYKYFKEEDIEGVESLKNNNISKKQKVRKYIKKIKIENLRSDIQGRENNEGKPENRLE